MLVSARSLEVQQHYYVTRVSEPHIPQHPNEEVCPDFPKAYCPTGNDVTLDMFNWTSAEIKAGVATPSGILAAYDCVTYAVCGFRIYDAGDTTGSQPGFSDPEPLESRPTSTAVPKVVCQSN